MLLWPCRRQLAVSQESHGCGSRRPAINRLGKTLRRLREEGLGRNRVIEGARVVIEEGARVRHNESRKQLTSIIWASRRRARRRRRRRVSKGRS
jgi:hypothetical protein